MGEPVTELPAGSKLDIRRPYGPGHIGFLVLLGALGWVTLLGSTFAPPSFLIFREWALSWELVACFALGGIARLLAARLFERMRIALDSAFYIATRFVFGTVPAAWIVVFILTVDAAVRYLRGGGPVPLGEAPRRYGVAHAFYNGGLPAFGLLLTGALFADRDLYAVTDLELAWLLPSFAVCFLAIHYLLAGSANWFLGPTSTNLVRRFFVRVVGAELTLIPLSLAMVIAYRHQGIGLFTLIGGIGLAFNEIFRRMTISSGSLHKRVVELSVLNKVARIISGSLDRQALQQRLARASLELVGGGSRFIIGLQESDSSMVAYELFDDSGEGYRRIRLEKTEGLHGWVMENRQPLILADVQRQFRQYVDSDKYNDPSFHSWLAVPLVVYEEVVGVMSVQTERRDAYTMDNLRVLTMIADQAAVAIENSKLYQLATVDGLTGLFVRRYFDQRLREEWHRSARYKSAFTLGLVDLDNFKKLNDVHGHQLGNQVLRVAAHALRSNMRSFDLAARYGGEEFVFILPRTSLVESAVVAERIRADVASLAIPLPDGREVRVTTSIGLAAPTDEMEDAEELLMRADQALYAAKARGKNRVVLSEDLPPDPGPNQAAVT